MPITSSYLLTVCYCVEPKRLSQSGYLLLFSSLYVCAYVCVLHMCIHVGMLICACTCGGEKSISSMFLLSLFSLVFWNRVSSQPGDHWLGYTAWPVNSWNLFVSAHRHHCGNRPLSPYPNFYAGAGDPELDLNTCTVSALPTEPFSSFPLSCFYMSTDSVSTLCPSVARRSFRPLLTSLTIASAP